MRGADCVAGQLRVSLQTVIWLLRCYKLWIIRMCSVVNALVVEYERATDAYIQSVRQLSDKIGTIPTREYALLTETAENARLRLMRARLDLEDHLSKHGCASLDAVLSELKADG